MLRVVLALTLLVGAAVAAPAAAETKRKAHRPHAPGAAVATPRPADYRELLADKLPVGSSQWWEQMRREGRLGGETP
jgi:hypothetical protein